MSEFNLKKYLSEGKLLKENALAQNLRDEAEHPDSKIGASIFNKYAKKIENADKEDYKKIIKAMESELISKHPDTFSGEDDIPGSFLSESTVADDYIVDQNAGYLVDQIADDMMYGEFDSKEDINKFLDSIIAGIEELRSQQLSNFKEITYLPDANSEGDDLEEGRHYYGAGMDDEYDEPRYSRGRRSSYKDALMNPPTPSGNQDEDEFDEEDIEFTVGKDYNTQNQRVLNRMDESNFNKTLKKASKKLEKINKRK